MPASQRPLRLADWRRWPLWLVFGGLLAGMLVIAVTLALRLQEHQAQQKLSLRAANLADQLRSGLLRNVRTLQALAFQPHTAQDWRGPALEILENNPEMVALERRDRDLAVVVTRASPFHTEEARNLPQEQRQIHIQAACAQASASHLPTYTASYAWSLPGGETVHAVDHCVPKIIRNELVGFLVVAYSLPDMLTELTDGRVDVGVRATLTDLESRPPPPGTRQAGEVRVAEHMLELTGHILVLRLESPREGEWLSPWSTPGLVVGLSALIALVALLLGRDLALRFKAERALAESLALRKAMENAMVTGLMTTDLNGRITYVNPAFCRLVRRPLPHLLGQSPPMPYWPAEAERAYQVEKIRQHAASSGRPEGIESRFARPDGSEVAVLIFETQLLDAEGYATGGVSAVVDLTEQRRAEAMARATQEQLQATARLASVGEMASLLSHELNQPLSAIASYAAGSLNLVERAHPSSDPVAKDLAEAMARIREQADRAGRVIQSVGRFVRRRQQADSLVREAVEPAQLVSTLLPLLNLQAQRDGIRVEVDIAANCPALLCDRTMVEQVLLNLARNGMQAMTDADPDAPDGESTPPDGRVLTLAVRPTAPPGDTPPGSTPRQAQPPDPAVRWLTISVTDHGHGLSAEVAQRLFTPFFSTRAEGMGLGLSLCRTVVEQHGGTLRFAPASPRGTVFSLTLPTVGTAPAGEPAPA